MLLSEIFTYLSLGELSQYAAGTEDEGSIAAKDYPKVISFVNRALTRLHTDLPIRMEQLILDVTPLKRDYLLTSANARSKQDYGYILDTPEVPFIDNLLLIDSVFNTKSEEFSLNDVNAENSLFTPKYNVLHVPKPCNEKLAILYRSNHPRITPSQRTNPELVEVEIPDTLLELLLILVQVYFFSGQGSSEGIQESQMKEGNYIQLLAGIKLNGLVQEDNYSFNVFKDNGWV